MYCSKCGTKNNDDANFCWNCGAPLAKKAIESYTQAVELALAGDERGFSYLYDETYKSKYYLALKYMDDKDAAEDVLQDAYIKAFSKLASLKEPETFPSWLGTIVANTAKNALQKKNPVLFTDLSSGEEDTDLPDFDVEDESVESQPEAAYTQQETKELVNEMISSLSEEQKMCILMYYIDGESVCDIAESLDCTESAVKSRLSYGRKNLKAKAEELQKKGYKLFTLAPIPLLLVLVHKDAEAAVCEKEFIAAGRRVAEEVLKKAPHIAKTAAVSQSGGTGAAAHQAGTGAAAKAAAGAGAAGKGGAGAGAAAGFFSTTAGKVVIFVVAVAVVTGAVVGGMHSHYVKQSEEVVVYEDDSVPEEPGQSGSEGTVTTPSPFDDASGLEADAAEDTAEANAPSVMSVQGLLELFPYMADNLLYEYYGGNEFLKEGITSPGQIYWLAACATIEAGVYSPPYYIYVDGEMQEWGFEEIDEEIGRTYCILPTGIYEEYLRNMFGIEYELSEFVEWDDINNRNVIMDNGTFYVPTGDYGYDDVEVTLEYISDTPDEDGTYSALAKYSESDPENGNALGEYYMLYRLKPDESSDYGCVIVDMAPAGEGEVDEEVLLGDGNDLSVIYKAYYDKLVEYQELYGEATINLYGFIEYINGLCMAKLIDLNADGKDELVVVHSDPLEMQSDQSVKYTFEVWEYKDSINQVFNTTAEYSSGGDDRIILEFFLLDGNYCMYISDLEESDREDIIDTYHDYVWEFQNDEFTLIHSIYTEYGTGNSEYHTIDGEEVDSDTYWEMFDQWSSALESRYYIAPYYENVTLEDHEGEEVFRNPLSELQTTVKVLQDNL